MEASEVAGLVEADFVVAGLAEEVMEEEVIAEAVHVEELRLVGLELEEPYQVDVEALIHIIVIILGVDIIGIGICLGIEDGGIRLIGRDIIVVLSIILRHIWEAV